VGEIHRWDFVQRHDCVLPLAWAAPR